MVSATVKYTIYAKIIQKTSWWAKPNFIISQMYCRLMLTYHLYGSSSLFFLSDQALRPQHSILSEGKKKNIVFLLESKNIYERILIAHKIWAQISRAEGILSQPVKWWLVRFFKIMVKVERGGGIKTGKIWMAMRLVTNFRLLILARNSVSR